MTYTSARKTCAAAFALLALWFAIAPAAQSVFNGPFFYLNGNRVAASAGTAVITVPNTTQTLLGTSTLTAAQLCTSANWCQATVTLTDANVKALPTTPITLVAAPGSGKRIKLLAPPSLHLDNTAGVYTNINTTYAAISVDWAGSWAAGALLNDNAASPALTQVTYFLNTSHAYISDLTVPYMLADSIERWVYSGEVDASGQPIANEDNVALKISVDNNGSGNFTGGNAANTLKVVVYYAIETL